jgi:hypothetical protein
MPELTQLVEEARATGKPRRLMRDGEQLVHTVDAVVFEDVFTLERTYKVPRERT